MFRADTLAESESNVDESHHRQRSSSVMVAFQNIHKSFDDVTVLTGISLDICQGEFFSLLGPSGCGKTTLLRILAGFEEPDVGNVLLDGVDISHLQPNQRNVNTVFQNFALFPHMSVFDNVAFGLKMRRQGSTEVKRRVDAALKLVNINTLAQRKPAQLSGGQKQRVALARALVNEPKVLLLDEPLSALDRKLRHQLQLQLVELQRRLGITFIFVTHDQEEALTMSDRIAVMRNGAIEQLGNVADIYERPASTFVAQFLGTSNLLEGRVVEVAGLELGRVRTDFGELELADTLPKRGDVTLSIRPEKIQLSSEGFGSFPNQVPVKVMDEIYCGDHSKYRLEVSNGVFFQVTWLNRKLGERQFALGDRLIAYLPPDALTVLQTTQDVTPEEFEGDL
jgi:spermidine/putrescine transport system ATP-binding protein